MIVGDNKLQVNGEHSTKLVFGYIRDSIIPRFHSLEGKGFGAWCELGYCPIIWGINGFALCFSLIQLFAWSLKI